MANHSTINSAVIFAGGKSSRMGRDKSLLPFGNFGSLAEYQYRRLQEVFSHVHISAKEDKFDFDASLLLDKYPTSSPMVAMVSILEELKTDNIFMLAVDMPFVDRDIMHKIILEHSKTESDILIAAGPNGTQPLCGIYSSSILPVAKRLLSNHQHKLHMLLEQCNTETLYFDDEKRFFNVNNPSDYTIAST